jgi:D-xylose transport system permease protein
MTVDPTAAPVERVPAGAAVDERHESETLSGYLRLWWQGVRAGELGTLPIIVGLALILIVFGFLEENFFTERNFTNLLLQMAAVATMAIGIVFVLLIGEIDLSVAFVSAVGAVVMTLLLRPGDPGWPWWAAIGFALLCTTAIGLVHAIVITKAGVPSFVVTLAGLLAWNGVVLLLIGSQGTVILQNEFVIGLANDFMEPAVA